MTGHRWLNTYVEVPMKLYPGVYRADSLLSKKFQHGASASATCATTLRIWEVRLRRSGRARQRR